MATCDGGGDEKLADVFDKIWSTYEKLENSSESCNSNSVQVNFTKRLKADYLAESAVSINRHMRSFLRMIFGL